MNPNIHILPPGVMPCAKKSKSDTPAPSNMTNLEEKFNKNIRPLLDAVDKLRSLKVTNEGIPLPSIVVVGDQSSGKSSVLESLAAINLPRGHGIATRVPLILRLQSCPSTESSIIISYKEPIYSTSGVSHKEEVFRIHGEAHIEAAVTHVTNVLAGKGKGVVDTPISLHIRKPGAPDLTMIDLPGITRVPVHGQPDNIYEQISAMIRRYLKPKETVILNVLSATVDFSTCESIRMSQEEDKKGERTLAVVTKVDRAPEEVYEKVTNDDVNIKLGYTCVRNRTDDDESHEQARERERQLFDTHPSLSQLQKDLVGIAALAERLTQIQADIIRRSLPELMQQIDKALSERRRELDVLMQGLPSGKDPKDRFLKIVDDNRNLMQDVLLNGNYSIFVDEKEMHYPPRLEEMFEKFGNKLHEALKAILHPSRTKEILLRMKELRGVHLPNFLSPVLMKSLVREEIDKVAEFAIDLVPKTHDYARKFVFHIIEKSSNVLPNLQTSYKHEADNALAISQESCMKFVLRVLDKERSNVFTLNDYYMANVRKLHNHLTGLRKSNATDYGIYVMEGFDEEESINLQEVYDETNDYKSAFDMKVNLAGYWKVVQKRMTDEICLELRFSLENALLQNLRNEVLKAMMGPEVDMSALMEEHASTRQKKLALQKRVEVLKECKGVLHALF